MAIDAATVWEVRSSGSSVNGSGFVDRDPGTSVDYSQQAAAELTVADLATDGAGTALSSATGGFTAAMAGNVIQISGGDLTADWYEITAYTDTNNVTIDRSAGASKSGGTGNVGGAFNFGTAADGNFIGAFVDGNIGYIESGSYTLGEAISTSDAGTDLLPMHLIGYINTRSTTPYGTDRPLIACTPVTTQKITFSGGYWYLSNLRFTGTYTSVVDAYTSGFCYITNCYAMNSSATANRYAFNNNSVDTICIGCEGISTNGRAFGEGRLFGCYAHDSDIGLYDLRQAYNCIVDTCASSGIHTLISFVSNNSTIYNCGTGIYVGTVTSRTLEIINTIIDGCTVGIDASAAKKGMAVLHCVLNNTSDFAANVANCIQIGNIIGDPGMTDPANGDFSIPTSSNAYRAGFNIMDYISGITI